MGLPFLTEVGRFDFDSSREASRHYWYLPRVARVRGARVQWLDFDFRLRDFIRHSPASHFAVVLRARLGFASDGTPCSISGRGLALGDTSQATLPPVDAPGGSQGFGGSRGVVVESFWPGGNFLYRDTARLPRGLLDSRWFRVRLEVDDDRNVRYRLASDFAEPHSAAIRDRAAHPVDVDADGALIALGRGPNETGPWSVEFRNIRCGWR